MKGVFITFEGCEGVGKSSQIRLLSQYLDREKVNYCVTREPGGEPVAEKIRNIILDGKNVSMTDECEALLYAASRVQHLIKEIKPRLEKGQLVICDRFIDSSFAYQGYARGLGYDFVAKINDYAIKNFMPKYTVFLNLDPLNAFKRKGGVDKNDRLELSGEEFHAKVYKGYSELAEKFPERFIVIDASGEKMQTHEKIVTELRLRSIIK